MKVERGKVVNCNFANVSRCLKRYETRVGRDEPARNNSRRRESHPIRTIRTSPGQKIAATSPNNRFLVFVELLGAVMVVQGNSLANVTS